LRRALQMTWLALALTVGISAASASGDVSLLLPIEAVFRTSFAPAKLPAHEEAPVSLLLTEGIGQPDGSHPPPLQELQLDLDRHLELSVKGVPHCGPLLQERPVREGVLEQCEDAKVGSGTVEVEVAFPEQRPVRTHGRVIVYNSGAWGGSTRFLLYALIPAPVTGTISMQLRVWREKLAPYGWKGVLTVPKIANGAGSITYLGVRFRKGIFSASCPSGKLLGQASSTFADGEVAASAAIRPCQTASG
jgi:hypothetical protein